MSIAPEIRGKIPNRSTYFDNTTLYGILEE